MPQFGAYLTIVIYNCKTFIEQATAVFLSSKENIFYIFIDYYKI